MRKINLFVCFVLLAGILMLFASNVHAFLITSELNLSIQLVPATPNSTMSLEWTGYSASADISVSQSNNCQRSRSEAWEEFDEPSKTTLEVATDQASMNFGISDNDVSFALDVEEDTLDLSDSDRVSWFGDSGLGRAFTIQGDGWLLISTVYAIDFESTLPFNFSYNSFTEMYLSNSSSGGFQDDTNYFNGTTYIGEDSSELTYILGLGLFFNDGDSGGLSAYTRNASTLGGDSPPPVPIPGAAWLLVCGLSCIVAVKKIL